MKHKVGKKKMNNPKPRRVVVDTGEEDAAGGSQY